MDSITLSAQLRDTNIKAKYLRKDGLIPAEFYGHGMENQSLQMDYQSFRRVYRKAGENTIIELKVDGGKDAKVLVHRVDHHPVSDDISYVEFINVRMDEKVTTHVPVHLEGQAPAVKELGGVLVQSLDEIEIRCLPGDLIHEVTLSIEPLVDFSSAIHVSDIKVSDKIEILTDLESTVASVSAPREEEPEEAPEMDVASVEVTGQKEDSEESSEDNAA